ncbi:hypothetical protein [Kribbella shirazensis]|uniref:DUF4352 domain-containing protein n=1 Tax=Kribbella shirazensis TaxID=1105143 RepID=A0A7X5V753_9ACTN|nr:hypothetical protein [Kribbella shirazensis]NIK55456.1 hypothetical protein [Kribbella shirazensis]
MKRGSRVSRLIVQVSVMVALLAVGMFVMLQPYLSDEERLYEEDRIDEVVSRGPVTLQSIEWKLDSLKVHTALVDEDGKEITVDAPAGSVIVVAEFTVTPRKGLLLKERGFSCEAKLVDSKGNIWDDQMVSGYPLPTYCGDSDHPRTMDEPGKVAQVYIVPKSTVPNLTGVTVEDFYIHRRVLLTP